MGPAEGTFNLTDAEVAHYNSRLRLRFGGTFSGLLLLLFACYSVIESATRPYASERQVVDLFLAAFLGVLGGYLLVSSIGAGILRGPHRLDLGVDGLSFDFPNGKQTKVAWQDGLPFLLRDLRPCTSSWNLGAPCLLTWGLREIGISGEAGDSIVAAARLHGLHVLRGGAGIFSPKGTVTYRFR